MGVYSLTFNDVDSGAVADTFKTMAALIVPDTAGNRFRLLGFNLGCAENSPVDEIMAVKLHRIADVSAGTAGTAGSTVSAANMAKFDPGSVASIISGKLNYSAEPTAYETEPLWFGEFNLRGVLQWQFLDKPPIFTQDSHLGLLASPRTATARKLTGTLIYEVF